MPSVNLTEKQRKYAKALIEGSTAEKAKELAGYSKNTPSTLITNSPKIRSTLVEALRKKGIGDNRIVKVIDDGLKAKNRNQPDHNTRHKFLDTLLKIRGDYSDKNNQDNSQNFSWEQMIINVQSTSNDKDIIDI